MSALTRRGLLGGAAGALTTAFAPQGLRLSTPPAVDRKALWRREAGPRLRGAVFVQRRVYRDFDGPSFLGPGPLGAPITDAALDRLAASGANLANWSGPGPFAERAPFGVDAMIEDHIAHWLDRCGARGLFTTLSLRSGPGRSAFAFHPGETWYPSRLYDASLWRDAEKQAAWVEMVGWTLDRFGDHPALAGVLAMAEPNASDLGRDQAWLSMATALARGDVGRQVRAPLLLSPDRWGRLEAADALQRAAGLGPVLITHDYTPWTYTHPGDGADIAFDPARAGPAPGRKLGAAGVLEFGAPRRAPDLETYLHHRITAYEAAGLNWSVYRWSSGWTTYEQQEGRRALDAEPRIHALLQRAFAANSVRPPQP